MIELDYFCTACDYSTPSEELALSHEKRTNHYMKPEEAYYDDGQR